MAKNAAACAREDCWLAILAALTRRYHLQYEDGESDLTSRATEFTVEWDESKNLLNQKRHRVSFEEAATVFADPLEIMIDDRDHSFVEHRFISIGESFKRRLLVVSYTERDDEIRIISARTPTRRERHAYEE